MAVRRLAICLTLAAALAAAAAAQAHPPQPSAPAAGHASAPAEQVVRVVEAFHAAIASGDAKAAAALLAEDAVIYEHGGVERTKAEYVAEHLPADIAYTRGLSETVTARSAHVAGDLAWVVTEGRTTGVHDGKPVDRLTTETMVLARRAGAWRIVHIHWSSGAAKAG